MTLGDLEFTPFDFQSVGGTMGILAGTDLTPLAEHVNRLLRERLEKASTVYSLPGWNGWHDKPFFRQGFSTASHTARLVCVEEIKK